MRESFRRWTKARRLRRAIRNDHVHIEEMRHEIRLRTDGTEEGARVCRPFVTALVEASERISDAERELRSVTPRHRREWP